MANMREIRTRMNSVNEIMKITNAMYLISSSKLKKARKQLEATEPYFLGLQSTMRDILEHTPEFEHIYFDKRPEIPEEERKISYIVFTSDKGLAGSFNHTMVKMAEEEMSRHKNTSLFVVGQYGRAYFANKKVMVDGEFLYTAQDPNFYRARSMAESMIELFKHGYTDEVRVIYTGMVSPIKSEPQMLKLLPLERETFEHAPNEYKYGEADFTPSPKRVMDYLVPSYLRGLLYGVMVESFSSEHNARMAAMDAATTSAKDMIRDLSLLYNRARQAAITQEITEVVSGANGLKK